MLLEVLVALAILGTAGASLAALATGATDTVRRTRAAERDIASASDFLEAVALWPREDLDRHLGTRPQGEWLLEVRHPVPTLYLVALSEPDASRPLLETALYRPVRRVPGLPANAP